MDGTGDHFLAGAGFADDEDSGIVAGHALDHAEKLAHDFAANHGDLVSDLDPVWDLVLGRAVQLFRRRRLRLQAYTQSFPCHRATPFPRAFHIIADDAEKVTFV